MSDVKWIKITTNMFEDEKIDFIESLPEADAILVIWAKLLCMAGKCNSNGFIMLTENIAYDEKMLAHKLKRNPNIVALALDTLVRLEMITETSNGFCITNFAKHQNVEGMDKIRELTRQRVSKHREQLKICAATGKNEVDNCNDCVTDCNVTCNVTVTQCNALDLDLDLERDKDLTTPEKPEEKPSGGDVPYQKIKELFHGQCEKLPQVRDITGQRKKHVRAMWKAHPNLDYFTELFQNASQSEFLAGKNDRAWTADFDWLMNQTNSTKVLEGKYQNKASPGCGAMSSNIGYKKVVQPHNNFDQRHYESEELEKFYCKI